MSRPFFIFFRNAIDKGILLVIGTILALFMSNSSLSEQYYSIIHSSISLNIFSNTFSLPLHLVVNDFLMSIFFLAVGIEIKQELINGHLSKRSQRVLPIFCAVFGVITPCIIYIYINNKYPQNMIGWAIPTATDIAFTIAVISMFSSKIPQSIKVFVTALAIIDDLIAIIAIAIFYTATLNIAYIFGIILCIILLCWINNRGVIILKPYIILGIVMFSIFIFSGVHSTVSGVVLGFCLPLTSGAKVLKFINKFVLYFIMPIFAFFNSGLSLYGFTIDNLYSPVTIGIFLGLFIGKQVGIFGSFYILVKSKIASIPDNAKFKDVYIAAVLCGIGFTMSIFVASLAFAQDTNELLFAKVGILLGSFTSALFGIALLVPQKKVRI